MKTKISLLTGFAFALWVTIFLSGCRKEEITPEQPTSQSAGSVQPPEYKFSAIARIPGEHPENGFLSLTVSSDDEVFLKKYVEKLEQSKIVMAEVNSTKENETDVKPLFGEEESGSAVALDFNWDNFSFNREKGKLYQIRMASAGQSKTLVYYTAYSNVSSFTSNWGYAAVNVYSLYRFWNLGCLCYKTINSCKWKFSNGQSYFYEQMLSYHDNLELRCFQNGMDNSTPTYSVFQFFAINGYYTYFRPRTNYTSPDMPAGYIDVTAITAASGTSLLEPYTSSFANLTLYTN